MKPIVHNSDTGWGREGGLGVPGGADDKIFVPVVEKKEPADKICAMQ